VIADAGPWVQQETPEDVTAALLDFLVTEAAATSAQ